MTFQNVKLCTLKKLTQISLKSELGSRGSGTDPEPRRKLEVAPPLRLIVLVQLLGGSSGEEI